MREVTITIKLSAVVDDLHETAEAVGHLLDGGTVQDAIIEYGADHGFKVEIIRSWHDVTRGHDDEVAPTDSIDEALVETTLTRGSR